MDDADLAQAWQEAEDALRARYKQPPAPVTHYSHCLECGEPIPEARQAHGFATCIDCAEAAERNAAKHRKV